MIRLRTLWRTIGGLWTALVGGYLGIFVGLLFAAQFKGGPFESAAFNMGWGLCVVAGFIGGLLLVRIFDKEIAAGEVSRKCFACAYGILAVTFPTTIFLVICWLYQASL